MTSGHREPRDIGDYAEFLVARLIGRSLTPLQGCVVQIVGVILFGMAFYWFLVSGTMTDLIKPITDWYASNAMHALTFTPRPS